jgi:hypothetical protein
MHPNAVKFLKVFEELLARKDYHALTTSERFGIVIERLAALVEQDSRERGEPLDEQGRKKLREAILAWLVEGAVKAQAAL